MTEELLILSGSILAFMTAVFGVFAKAMFVPKSQVFDKKGKPFFQYKHECDIVQHECAARTCAKIKELKDGQHVVEEELKMIKELLVRIDQKVIDREKWNGINRRNSLIK